MLTLSGRPRSKIHYTLARFERSVRGVSYPGCARPPFCPYVSYPYAHTLPAHPYTALPIHPYTTHTPIHHPTHTLPIHPYTALPRRMAQCGLGVWLTRMGCAMYGRMGCIECMGCAMYGRMGCIECMGCRMYGRMGCVGCMG